MPFDYKKVGAKRAQETLKHYSEQLIKVPFNLDRSGNLLVLFLTDLRHFCHKEGVDFNGILMESLKAFAMECKENSTQLDPCPNCAGHSQSCSLCGGHGFITVGGEAIRASDPILKKQIPPSEATKQLECRNLDEAKGLMAAAGVEFDQIYYTIFGGRLGDYTPVHYYFNNGPANNVGYYTPNMNVLNIFMNGRADATPLHERTFAWKKN